MNHFQGDLAKLLSIDEDLDPVVSGGSEINIYYFDDEVEVGIDLIGWKFNFSFGRVVDNALSGHGICDIEGHFESLLTRLDRTNHNKFWMDHRKRD